MKEHLAEPKSRQKGYKLHRLYFFLKDSYILLPEQLLDHQAGQQTRNKVVHNSEGVMQLE